MIKSIGIALIILTLAPAPMSFAVAHAPRQAAYDHDEAKRAVKRGEIMPYSKIRKVVKKRLNGKIVGERLRRTNRGWVYELRVRQQEGKVMFVLVDARTGQILERR